MEKEMVSMDDVRECFKLQFESLERQEKSWEDSMISATISYCKPDSISGGTSLINVCNVVNQAGEIKALCKAKEYLETALRLIESASKKGV